ncbi:1-acyl-sn-glycerol-3-phosphate acyltransferase beta-like [Arctopsyche grandis]|uniref:1-acyl-sn-glycerol-3-phosphate acyltransferase beta-like n=1 Tax=Arctopsyche grandis TaxID=121162 RepID=UPI00406DA102
MFSWSFILYSLPILLAAYVIKQLLSKSDNIIKFQSKFFVFFFLSSTLAVICIPLFAFNPKNVKNCLYAASILKHITKIIGLQWILRRGHVLAEDRGCVIVANHQSMIDVLGMFNIWHVMVKCASIAKKELFYIWPFGLAAYLAGVVFIDRNSPKNSYNQLNATSEIMVKNKTKIWLFPEGTRNTKRGILTFRRGAFKVAIDAQVPIIPIVYSPYYFINREKKFFGKGRVIITCLDPIETKGLTLDDMDDLMKKVRDAMLECYNEVCKEVLSSLPADYPLAPA